jgi:hypothetical protein
MLAGQERKISCGMSETAGPGTWAARALRGPSLPVAAHRCPSLVDVPAGRARWREAGGGRREAEGGSYSHGGDTWPEREGGDSYWATRIKPLAGPAEGLKLGRSRAECHYNV